MLEHILNPKAHSTYTHGNSILNALIYGYGIILVLFLIIASLNSILSKNSYDFPVLIGVIIYTIILSGAWYLNNKTHAQRIATYIFIALIAILPISISLQWSPLFPQALLMYALVITVSNVLIGKVFGIRITLIASIVIIGIVAAHINGYIKYDTSWNQHLARPDYPYNVQDAIAAAATLLCIHIITFFSTRQREHALEKLKESEEQLRKERDTLEERVIERTKELQETQRQKFEEINNFTAFGRISSGVIHELVNPLMAIELRLGALINTASTSENKELTSLKQELSESIQDVKHMEQVIIAARKQFQRQHTKQVFNLANEIHNVHRILKYQLRSNRIITRFEIDEKQMIYGDPLKFNQLISNLLSNAIHACESNSRTNNTIAIETVQKEDMLEITITDSGIGISEKNMPHIYEALFTTKSSEEGTGLGLYLCKKIVEDDFHGTIQCISKENRGSTFIVTIPHKHNT